MRVKCIIQYDGTKFFGFQRQPSQRTIQGEIESVLKAMSKKKITIHPSGRTDAKVHARHQVIHFDLDMNISESKLQFALNGYLPDDIYISELSFVDDDFHSRYHVKKKEYRYYIKLGERNPFEANYYMHYRYELNIDAMKEAVQYFVGTHDFTSFGSKLEPYGHEKTIYTANIIQSNNELMFQFVGSGFLRYQVRIMVGTLIEVGRGKRKPKDIIDILNAKDRKKAGKRAEPQGLYLHNVEY